MSLAEINRGDSFALIALGHVQIWREGDRGERGRQTDVRESPDGERALARNGADSFASAKSIK